MNIALLPGDGIEVPQHTEPAPGAGYRSQLLLDPLEAHRAMGPGAAQDDRGRA